MTQNSKELDSLEASIDTKKVESMVVDALQEILPHVKEASTAEIMMAYAVMIKSTLIGMELTEAEKDQAMELFNQIFPKVLVGQVIASGQAGMALH